MSDNAVRHQLKNFFQTPAIAGMSKVYLDEPLIIQGANWNVQAELGWGAVGFTHLDTSSDTRITLGAAIGGQKEVKHTIGFCVQFQYLIPTTLAPGVDEDAWVDPFDSVIDAIKTRIRSDPTLGGAGAIFQGGQDANDIRVTRDFPQEDVGKIIVFAVVEFDCLEIITA